MHELSIQNVIFWYLYISAFTLLNLHVVTSLLELLLCKMCELAITTIVCHVVSINNRHVYCALRLYCGHIYVFIYAWFIHSAFHYFSDSFCTLVVYLFILLTAVASNSPIGMGDWTPTPSLLFPLPLPFPSLLFSFPPFFPLFPFPSPNIARDLGSAVSFRSGVWGRARPNLIGAL